MGSVSLSQGDSGYSVTATASWTTGPKVTINITYNSGEWSWRIRGRNPDTKVYLEGTGSTRTASFDAVDGKDYAFQVYAGGTFSNGDIFTVNFDSDSGGDSGGGNTGGETCYLVYYNDGGYTWDSFPGSYDIKTENKTLQLSQPSRNTSTSTSNFTITGDANGGNSNTSLNASAITNTTYTFAGWTDDKGNKWMSTFTGNYDTTMYASQSSNTSTTYSNNTLASLPKPSRNGISETYTISFNGNGGTPSKTSDTVTKNINYNFAYWCSNREGTGIQYNDSTSFTSATTVYAKWDATGGVNSVTLPTATREGYILAGWAESQSSEYVYTDTYNPTRSITLYAQWMAKDNITYTVNHHIKNLGSSTYSHHSSENKTATADTVLTLSNLKTTIEGFTYKEGKVNGNVVTTTTVKPDGSLAINLYYDRNLYTVTVNKSSNIQNVSGSGSYEHGASVTVEATFDTVMYHFTNWTGNSSLNITTNPATFIMPANNISITPNIEYNTYTIIFDGNGSDGGYTPSMTMTMGTAKNLSSNGYYKSGYTFTGWNTKANGSDRSFTDGQNVNNLVYENNGTITLYAQWKSNSFTITYDANGGSGAPSAGTKQYDVTYTISNTRPTRTGYTFLGWSTSSGATSASYQPGGSYTENKSITLYAVWSIDTYTITYDANGGSGVPLAGTKQYDVSYTISSTVPTKSGYTFLGWSTSSGATSASYQPGGSYTENKSITLYAVWSIDSYSIGYDANGGSGAPSAGTKKHDVSYTISSTKPTRTGYTFLGWSTSSSATSASYQPGGSYTENKSITLYAVWKASTYTITYNANGGTGAPSAGTKTHGVTYTISTKKPTKDGYNFAGWGTSSGATSASYQPGGSYTSNKSITLYAIWSIDTYTNTINHILRGFKNNDGNTESGSGYLVKSETFTNSYKLAINLNVSNAISDIPNGFVLNQQYGHVNENGGITYYNMNSTIYQEDSNMTFNFYYDPIEYPISYNLNGGNNDSNNPATYNVLYGVLLNEATKPGSRFSNWTDNKNVIIAGINEGKTATFTDFENLKTELSTRSTGSITVYANWETLGSTSIPGVGTYQCFIYKNGEWVLCAPHIVKNGAWKPY